MKKLFKTILLVAAAATLFASCQKEQGVTSEKETVKLMVHAKAENLAGETKTSINGDAILWGTGEYMTAALIGEDSFTTYNSKSSSADFWDGKSEAMFEFDVALSAGPVTYGGIYPTSAVVDNSNENPKEFKVKLSSGQKATANSYDPSAYIMIAKPEASDEAKTEWVASFRRATALNKITLTNLEDNIISVKITVPEGKYLAGSRRFDLTTGESGSIYTNQTNTVTVNYETALASNEDKTIWFTSWGVEIPEGAKMTVVAYSDNYSYTREITAKVGGIKFNEGFLNTLSINMASAVKESLTDYSGDYLIVSGVHLLTTHNAGNYFEYTDAAGTSLNDFYEITEIENYVWTVTKLDDGSYSIRNNSTGKYLALTAGDKNAAHQVDNADENTARFTITEENSALTIYSKAYPSRILRCNTQSPRFAFYASETGTVATLLAYTPDTRTPFDAVTLDWDSTNKSITWDAVEGASNGYEYTKDGGVSTTSVSTTSIDCSSWPNGDYSVKVRVLKTDNKKASDWSTACEFTISGGAAAVYYKKITSNPDDWSGEYLLVAESAQKVLTYSKNASKGYYATDVAISNSQIESNPSTDAHKVIIAKSGEAYSVCINGSFLSKPSSSGNIAEVSSVSENTARWTPSTSGLANKSASTWNLRYNSGVTDANGPFRIYNGTTTGEALSFYKLDDGKIDPEVTTTPKTINTNGSQDVSEMFDSNSDGAVTYTADGGTLNPSTHIFTADEAGEYTITFTQEANDTYRAITKKATITVTEPEWTLQSIAITTPPTKTEYEAGDKFNPEGMVVTGAFKDETKFEKSWEVSGYTYPTEDLTEGTTNALISYTYNGETKTADQSITVKAATTTWKLKSIAITTPPTKTEYTQGEALDLTGMVVSATYEDEARVKDDKVEPVSTWTSTPEDGATLSVVGEITVTVSFKDGTTKTATQKVTVVEKEPDPVTITLTASNFASSYSSNRTFTHEEIGFSDNGVCYNQKNTPSGVAAKQVIQMRKSGSGAGTIYNTTSLGKITEVKVYVVNAESLAYNIYSGSSSNPNTNNIESSSITPTDEQVNYTNTDSVSATTTAKVYSFDLSSYNAAYFSIVNGSKAGYLAKIEITYIPAK